MARFKKGDVVYFHGYDTFDDVYKCSDPVLVVDVLEQPLDGNFLTWGKEVGPDGPEFSYISGGLIEVPHIRLLINGKLSEWHRETGYELYGEEPDV